MEESDSSSSGSSLGQILMKYRKKIREDRISRTLSIEALENSNNININIPPSSVSISVSIENVVSSSKDKKKTVTKKAKGENTPRKRKMPKATTHKTNTPTNSERGKDEADPEFIPKSHRNYLNLTSKELDSIASRVRVFHETGIVLSDDDDIIPCQNKNKNKKQPKNNNQTTVRGPPVCGTRFGQGKIGTTQRGFGARKCACCNVNKAGCALQNLCQRGTPVAFCGVMDGMPENMRDQLRQREEHLLRIQQRDLLKHPELIELDDSHSSSPALPPECTVDKQEWVEKFICSMSADRVDYGEPKKLNIVNGISQKRPSEVHFKIEEQLADSLDAKTIVQRVDFDKEMLRQSRLDDWLKSKTIGKFHTNELAATSTPRTDRRISAEECADTLNKIHESREPPVNLYARKIYTDQQPSTSATPDACPASNDFLQDCSLRTSIMQADPNILTSTRVGSILDDSSDLSHLDRSNITLRTPQSKLNREAGHISITSSSKPKLAVTTKLKESEIMHFVDGLVAAEQEEINQEVLELCERMLEPADRAQNVLHDALDEILITSDNSPIRFDDVVLDNSVEIIDPIPESPIINNNNSIQLIDSDEDVFPIVNLLDVSNTPSPSTSRGRATRSSNRKRPIVQTSPARAAKRRAQSKKATNLPAISEVASTTPIQQDDMVPKESTSSLRNSRDCPICLESLASKEISSTICGHVFCTACIKAAVKAKRACPNCRTSLTLKKIHPLFI